jgi:hypothetical protein
MVTRLVRLGVASLTGALFFLTSAVVAPEAHAHHVRAPKQVCSKGWQGWVTCKIVEEVVVHGALTGGTWVVRNLDPSKACAPNRLLPSTPGSRPMPGPCR